MSKKIEVDKEHSIDLLLIQALKLLVVKDDYYSVDATKNKLAGTLGEAPRWLSNSLVGRRLKKLGFKEKRKVGAEAQYRLTPTRVQGAALRLTGPSNPS